MLSKYNLYRESNKSKFYWMCSPTGITMINKAFGYAKDGEDWVKESKLCGPGYRGEFMLPGEFLS